MYLYTQSVTLILSYMMVYIISTISLQHSDCCKFLDANLQTLWQQDHWQMHYASN